MSATLSLDAPSQLHTRILRFSTWWLATFALLLAILAAMYSTYPVTLPRRFLSLLPFTVFVFSTLSIATLWLRRRSSASTHLLYSMDTALVLLASCDFGLSVLMSADKVNNIYSCFFWNSFMLTAHTLIVPASTRRVFWLAVASMMPLLGGALGIAADRPELLPAPLPVFVAGALLYSAATVTLISWVRRSGLLIPVQECTSPAKPSEISRLISSVHRPLTRAVLRGIQFAAVRLAHRGHQSATLLKKAYQPRNVLVAKRLSEEIPDGSKLLDVGCGNGYRLHEIALFRELSSARGVDVVPPAPVQSRGCVQLTTFDGQNLPFADKSVDVAMICYVLHHLHPEHAAHILKEALRVASHKVIVLEDSLPLWTRAYRLRNWAHRVDADPEYAGGSDIYKRTAGQAMFLSHHDWLTYLSALPGVRRVEMESLHPPMKYRHHTMFVLEIAR